MKALKDLTQKEADELNAQTKADLAEFVSEYEVKKSVHVSSAIQKLINITESETHKVEFSGPAGKSTIEVMVSPPQKMLEDLFKIGSKAENKQEPNTTDEDRLCEILAYICVDPKIPFDVWKSGQLSDEIAAKIIFELMKHKATKHEEMVSEIEAFRPDKGRSKNTGNQRAVKKSTK